MAKNERFLEMLYLLKENDKKIFLDIETTALLPNDNFGMIIEVAAVKYSKGKIIDRFSTLINPGIKLPKKTTEITNITDEMVKDKPFCRDVLIELNKFCENETIPIVGHNISFDLRFLNYFGSKWGLHFGNQSVDTSTLSRHYLKNEKSYKLENLCHKYGVRDDGHHRALNDVLVNIEFYKFLLKNTTLSKDLLNLGSKPLQLIDSKSYKNKDDIHYKVTNCSLWEKEIHGRVFKRVYMIIRNENDVANVYIDLTNKNWGIKDSSFESINFKNVEKELMQSRMINESELYDINYWRR